MKRLLFCLALLCGLASAQVDIPVSSAGPIRDVARNVTWTGSGQSAFNNNYIFTPYYPNEGVCLYVANNDLVNTHTFAVQFFGTSDQNVKTYQGNTSKWTQLGPTSANIIAPSLVANSSVNYFLQAQAQSAIAIVLSGGSGVSTATVTIVESPSGTGCGNIPVGPVFCPLHTFAALASTITLQLTGNPATGLAPYVCFLVITFNGTPAAGNITIEHGTGANCAAATQTDMVIDITTTTPQVLTFTPTGGQPLIGRYESGAADSVGNAICIVNNQATTLEYFASTAQF